MTSFSTKYLQVVKIYTEITRALYRFIPIFILLICNIHIPTSLFLFRESKGKHAEGLVFTDYRLFLMKILCNSFVSRKYVFLCGTNAHKVILVSSENFWVFQYCFYKERSVSLCLNMWWFTLLDVRNCSVRKLKLEGKLNKIPNRIIRWHHFTNWR